jgi:hypothetical protein
MGKSYKDRPEKWRKHSDNKPKGKNNKPKIYEQDQFGVDASSTRDFQRNWM